MAARGTEGGSAGKWPSWEEAWRVRLTRSQWGEPDSLNNHVTNLTTAVIRLTTVARKEEGLTSKMLSVCTRKMVLLAPLLLMMGLISTKAATAEEESGTAIPAESRPCVDCHAFEFMQRALQDLKKTAYNLDSRTEMLLFKVEKRSLCDCLATNALN